ncbi:MAG TPA: hypothetical protein VNI82_00055 [Candidatus Nitrosotenuis sp.]|nr:hypothetical protein [Candidatus Nitrosotenuis sp.]
MKKIILFSGLTLAAANISSVVSAASPAKLLAVCGTGAGNFFGIQPWYACLDKSADGSPKITSINDIFLIIFPLVESLVKIGALVAAGVIFFLLIQIMVARGNAGKIATAVTGIKDAFIGFMICLTSIAIVNFIAGAFKA